MTPATIITIPEMAHALRLSTDSEAVDSTIVEILARMMVAGLDAIEAYAPAAGTATKAEALIRLVRLWYDSNPANDRMPGNAFVQSGARAMLSTWRISEGVRV